ncbi:MAG: TraR/DksA family transcriptional regulator [Kiritimatiellia bacterium]
MVKNKISKAGKTVKPAAKPAKPAKPVKSVAKKIVKSLAQVAKPAKAAPAAIPVRAVKVSAPQAKKPAAPVAAAEKVPARTVQFNSKDLEHFRKELIALRDRLTGQVAKMRQDSLTRDDEVNPEEDGSDAFDRLFTLERAGSDQDIIFTIDESIRAIDEGSYGVCEACSSLIEKPRLYALPFAKNCIRCQSEMERGRNKGGVRRQVP